MVTYKTTKTTYGAARHSTPEEESDNDKISLDLKPHLTGHPGCAEVSEGSVEFDPDETKMEAGLGWKCSVNSIYKEPVIV